VRSNENSHPAIWQRVVCGLTAVILSLLFVDERAIPYRRTT
jgi:hypothetical protein